MSGIAGVHFRDGIHEGSNPVQPMLAVLTHRGGNGEFVWSDAHTALGLQHAALTPEAPMACAAIARREHLHLVADVRLDDRETLRAALGLSPEEWRTIIEAMRIDAEVELTDAEATAIGAYLYAIASRSTVAPNP